MVISRKKLRAWLLFLLMLGVFLIYSFPTLWVISTSFKQEVDALAMPPKWIFTPTLDNYKEAFVQRGLWPNFINSVIISVGSSLLALIVGTPAAYALSRFRIKRKEDLSFWFLSTRMAPPVLAALPFFIISRQLGLYDTQILLIIVNVLTSLAWVIWMMRSFFDDIPKEIDEAAMVDGFTRFGALARVIMPLVRPGLGATIIFCLILSWNEYFFALILTSVNAKTLPAAITSFITIHGLLWGPMSAAGTVVMLPILIFVLVVQKQLLRGMTMGAVKG